MKQIRNTTPQPLRIPLAGGKTLHLGPLKAGKISTESAERPQFRQLVDAGLVVVLGEGEAETFDESAETVTQAAPHGHHPPTGTLVRGNR